ncbi:MAG: hypothetical protein AAB602_01810 [Patescibacteria group bacterium]
MGTAIGLAALVIVFSMFLPHVLRALENFLLAFFYKATAVINSLPASQPVQIR